MKKWNNPVLEELNITETAHKDYHDGGYHDNKHPGHHPDNNFGDMTPPGTRPTKPGCGSGSGESEDDTEGLS